MGTPAVGLGTSGAGSSSCRHGCRRGAERGASLPSVSLLPSAHGENLA